MVYSEKKDEAPMPITQSTQNRFFSIQILIFEGYATMLLPLVFVTVISSAPSETAIKIVILSSSFF